MIREWENGCQKIGKQRPEDPRAQERNTAEWKSNKNGIPVRVLNTSESFQDQDTFYYEGDQCSILPVGIWTKFYKPDPHIALGKYSPLEKEILRLGGVHTVAARRFLTFKQEEEQKMLRKLQLRSSDYKMAVEYKNRYPLICSNCGPLRKKLWTAKVIVPPEEFQIPPRERLDVSKHRERMQFARALRNNQLSPITERCKNSSILFGAGLIPMARDNVGEGEDKDNDDNDDEATAQEEGDEVKDKTAKRQEIKMNVTFKSEEPQKYFTYQPNHLKPLFPTKKAKRSIAGLTNRNLIPLAEFPGDLLLMNQDFISRGIHSSDVTKANHLEEESFWKESTGKPASHCY